MDLAVIALADGHAQGAQQPRRAEPAFRQRPEPRRLVFRARHHQRAGRIHADACDLRRMHSGLDAQHRRLVRQILRPRRARQHRNRNYRRQYPHDTSPPLPSAAHPSAGAAGDLSILRSFGAKGEGPLTRLLRSHPLPRGERVSARGEGVPLSLAQRIIRGFLLPLREKDRMRGRPQCLRYAAKTPYSPTWLILSW